MTKITGIPAIVVRREQKKGDRPPLSQCEEWKHFIKINADYYND